MWLCDFDGCTRPSVRNQGDCVLCNRHICAQHLTPDSHKCPTWEENEAEYFPAMRNSEQQEIEQLIKKINLSALTDRASALRHGIPCTIVPLFYDHANRRNVMGGMNYHIELQFSDGIVWLARIRRVNASSPPPQVRDMILTSEVVTLNLLRRTKIPIPIVYDFALEGPDNPVGVSFMLQEKMTGRACAWSQANPEQKVRLMQDLADVYIELSAHSFDALGSPVLQPTLSIGPLARESLIDFESSSGIRTTGPFRSLQDYHVAEIESILQRICRREMYARQPVDAYLIHLFLLEILPKVTKIVDTTKSGDVSYFLKHADDKGDHILVDDDYHITALIDWEWAYTVPAAVAFNSPIMLLNVGEFYNSNNSLSTDEVTFAKLLEQKGRPDLANHVKNGRIHHRYSFCCGYDLSDWSGFLGLFRGLRRAVDVDAELEWPEWKDLALERFGQDEGLRQVLRME